MLLFLIQNTPERADAPYDDIPNEEVVDTIRYDIMEAMEWKNGKICDDYDSNCGEEHNLDDDT